MLRSGGGRWFRPRGADTESTHSVLLGHQKGTVGGVVGQGWVLLTSRGRYRANAFGTAQPSKRHGGWCGGSAFYNVQGWFEVVGGRDTKIGWWWVVLTPRGRYRAHALSTAWLSKMYSRGYIGSVRAGFHAWFEVVRCQDSELERGPGIFPAKPITECDATCIGLVWRLLSRIVYRVHEVMRKLW